VIEHRCACQTRVSMKQGYVEQYAELGGYAQARTKELSELLRPYIEVTDRYGQLICGVVSALGKHPPSSPREACLRDLLADVFDFLYEARPLIVKGKLEIAYPLARRAYESLSLMVACHLDPEMADKWERGAEISNAKVRAVLGNHPRGEDQSSLQELYKFFSATSHPNRGSVAGRLLGDGNSFVLGSVGLPSLVLLADYALKTLSLWYWFAAFCVSTHLELLEKAEPDLGADYLETERAAREVHEWLTVQFNRVLAEEQGRSAE
jgi:hypothetical protein